MEAMLLLTPMLSAQNFPAEEIVGLTKSVQLEYMHTNLVIYWVFLIYMIGMILQQVLDHGVLWLAVPIMVKWVQPQPICLYGVRCS